VFCSFPHIHFVCILLHLSPSISFLNIITNDVFKISNFKCALFVKRKVLDFCVLTCVVKLCYTCLRFCNFFVCRQSCHLWIETVLCIYFSCLCFSDLSYCTRYTMLNRSSDREHPCLTCGHREKVSIFFTIRCDVSYWIFCCCGLHFCLFLLFCRCSLSIWRRMPVFLVCLEYFLLWLCVGFYQMLCLLY
jgi:hypothetical protein